ncbi:hypothetical protein PNQ29_06455 [Halobacterium salinarum]|uniref:hypothetical protein n=1 Tax=Halobacterium salinarum TaxID=2242 RepID=UPI0025572C8D|nr:hypothetical protein [Halobacterium salinarum]MDL0119372.1 hypothetical protein [Halobacterium salinarum]
MLEWLRELDPVKKGTIVIGLAVIAVPTFVFWRWRNGISPFGEFLQAIGIASSGILSALLIFLYSDQQSILKEQTKLTRKTLGGELGVNKCIFGGSDADTDDLDNLDDLADDRIYVKVANFSESKITNLSLKTEIFPKETGGKELGVRDGELQREDEHGTQFGQDTGIMPGEQGVPFSGVPSVSYEEDGREHMQELTYLIAELRDHNVKEVGCRMWIEGTDQLDETVKSKILPFDRTIRIDASNERYNTPTLKEVFFPHNTVHIDEDRSEF